MSDNKLPVIITSSINSKPAVSETFPGSTSTKILISSPSQSDAQEKCEEKDNPKPTVTITDTTVIKDESPKEDEKTEEDKKPAPFSSFISATTFE